MSFRVELSRRAFGFFRELENSLRERVAEKLKMLEGDPLPRGCRKLRGEADAYRLRVGEIRILYKILRDEGVVLVFKIGRRKSIYR
jgi:mRNA interferase RelE/StbE